MSDIDLGPVGYLVVEFQGANMTGEGLQELVTLVDRGLIRILDLAFVAKQDDGSVIALDIADYDRDGEFDLTIFEGASSALLDDDDLHEAGSVLANGSTAAVLLYENTWAVPLVGALRRNGAELVAAGFIPHDDLVGALDAAESSN
ncbi:MAG TPA: DUF6325 family protein [Aeromicrobium sp.]|nr:DUF6325 family protein [Aeromicrobium sp.]